MTMPRQGHTPSSPAMRITPGQTNNSERSRNTRYRARGTNDAALKRLPPRNLLFVAKKAITASNKLRKAVVIVILINCSPCIGFFVCRECKSRRPRSLCKCFFFCRVCKFCRPRSLCNRFFVCRACKYYCPHSLCICFFVCRACKYCRPRSLCIRFFACRACKYRCPRSLCIRFLPCRAGNDCAMDRGLAARPG